MQIGHIPSFREPLDFVTDDLGHNRPLGFVHPDLFPPDHPPMFAAPPTSFVVPELSDEEIRDAVPFDLRERGDYPLTVKDQDSRGACNGSATAEAVELVRWLRGQPHVPLSMWFVYAILCRGRDRGSSISEAHGLIHEKGIAPEADVKYGTINPDFLSATAYANALNYRVEFSAMLETWRQIVSAVLLGYGIDYSIRVGRRFELDRNGIVTPSPGVGNHAITAGHGFKRVGSDIAILWQNHWTPKWGQDGYAYSTEAHWKNQNYREAYAVRTVIDDPTDTSTFPRIP